MAQRFEQLMGLTKGGGGGGGGGGGRDPIYFTMHNLRDDRRDSFLEASNPLVKMLAS